MIFIKGYFTFILSILLILFLFYVEPLLISTPSDMAILFSVVSLPIVLYTYYLIVTKIWRKK